MTAVWAQRYEELLNDCVVSPHVFAHIVDRLCDCIVPEQQCLETQAGQRHVHLDLESLFAHLDRKHAEKIAALVDVERLVMQGFIGTALWDHRLRSQQLPEAQRRLVALPHGGAKGAGSPARGGDNPAAGRVDRSADGCADSVPYAVPPLGRRRRGRQ